MNTNENICPRYKKLIWEGEMTMLNGHPEQAEQIYLEALMEAKDLAASDVYWFKIMANLRYLYVNFLCQRPLTPDRLYERTVPMWSQVLGPNHHFIVSWVELLDEWRERKNNEKSHAE